MADAPLMVRMDADDIMHPERLRLQVAELANGWDVVGSRAWVIDNATELRGAFAEPALPATHAGFLRSNAFSHPTVAGRTDWLQIL